MYTCYIVDRYIGVNKEYKKCVTKSNLL